MKMTIKYACFIIVCSAILFSCSDDDVSLDTDCRNTLIEYFDMEPFVAEDEESLSTMCHSFIRYFEHDGTRFAFLDNYCADFGHFDLIGCDGISICKTTEVGCIKLIDEGTEIGIIGIDK